MSVISVSGESGCVHPACVAVGLLQGLKGSTGNDLRVINDSPLSIGTHRDSALADQSVRRLCQVSNLIGCWTVILAWLGGGWPYSQER